MAERAGWPAGAASEIPELRPGRSPAVPLRAVVTAGLVTVVATVSAVAVSLTRPQIHGAEARIIVNTRGYDSEPEAARVLATQRLVLKSEPVLGPVAEAAGIRLAELRRAVAVRVVDDSEVLSVVVGHRDRSTARRLAEGVVAAYVDAAMSGGDPVLAELSTFLTQLRTEAAARPRANRDRIEALTSLEDRLAEMRDRAQLADVRILSPARVLAGALQPRPLQAAAGGLLVGLLLAGGVLFGWRMAGTRR